MVKVLKSALVIISILALVFLLDTYLVSFLSFLFNIKNFWYIILWWVGFFSISYILVMLFIMLIWKLISKISIYRTPSFFILLTLLFLSIIPKIVWNFTKIPESNNYNGISYFLAIMLSSFKIAYSLTFPFLLIPKDGNIEFINRYLLKTIYSIVSILLIIGVGMFLCLFSVKISNISPNETYGWISGLWHGILIIPNYIVYLFDHSIIIKAPLRTTAYNLLWYVGLAFSIMPIISIVPALIKTFERKDNYWMK